MASDGVGWSGTRTTLQRVATHVVARARHQATGRFGLRVTPGGFGTPELGPEPRRVRVSRATLVVESGAAGAAWTRVVPIGGTTLAGLASVADVDLGVELDVGHDTPPLGDPDEPLACDGAVAASIGAWFTLAASGLDRVLASGDGPDRAPSVVQLWPEHFDVAVDVAVGVGGRSNLGASPGDAYSDEPYLYVGPWGPERPGGGGYWNAPFGAVLTRSALAADALEAAVAFWQDGLARLGQP